MNLDGTEREYRVLKNVSGDVYEVLGMEDLSTSTAFNSNGTNTYAGNTLDTYLNTTWYGTLSTAAKNAIVPKTITQDSWYSGTSGSPQYSGTYNGTLYTISKGSDNYAAIGSRYVYAMSMQEVLDYLSDESVLVDTSEMLRDQNILKMFWNETTSVFVSGSIWLRSAEAGYSNFAWAVYGGFGRMNSFRVSTAFAVRPAFQINLSLIPFTKST